MEMMAAMSLEQFLESYRVPIDRLYSAGNAGAWHVSRLSFAAALWRSFERRFGANVGAVAGDEAVRFLDSLHAADLALAVGCRDGDADAWRHLVAVRARSSATPPAPAFGRGLNSSSSGP